MSERKKNIIYYTVAGLLLTFSIVLICCTLFIKPSAKQTLNVECQDEIVIELGEEYQIPVECSDMNATISLKSADERIIQAKEASVIGIKEGNTMLHIQASNGKIKGFKNIYVKVKKTITDLSVSVPKSLTLYLIDKSKTKAYADNFYNYQEYTCPYDIDYTISNNEIISIKNNKITALKEGEADLTFISKDQPEVVSKHKVIINKISPTFNLTSKESLTLDVGETSKIKYSILPSYYTGEANISYVFSNPAIASISDKTISTISPGETVLNIYLNEKLVNSVNILVNSLEEIIENTTPPTEQDPEDPNQDIEDPSTSPDPDISNPDPTDPNIDAPSENIDPIVPDEPEIQEPDPIVTDEPKIQEPDPIVPEEPEIQNPDPIVPDEPENNEPDPVVPEEPDINEPDPVDPEEPEIQEPDPVVPEEPEIQEPDPVVPEEPEIQEPDPIVTDEPGSSEISDENKSEEKPKYSLLLKEYTGCIIEENIIKITADTAIFYINIFDNENNLITSGTEIKTEGIILTSLLKGRFAISVCEQCSFTLFFDSLNFSQIIKVEIV